MLKYTLLFAVFLLISCKSNKYPIIKSNFTYGNKLINRDIKIGITFFGDMKFAEINKKKYNEILRITRNIKELENKFSIVSITETTVSPSYKCFLFYCEKYDSQLPDGLIVNNEKEKFVLFKKSEGSKCCYLLIVSNSKENNNSTILVDGNSIANTITFNEDDFNKITYFDIFNEVRDYNNYLIAKEKLANAPLDQSSNQKKFDKFQFLITINSFISDNKDYDELIFEKEKSIKDKYQSHIDSLLTKRGIRTNEIVKEEISQLIKDNKVIMLNEQHWYPKHRLLADLLLKKLKDNGFKYIAIEAINPKMDSILNTRKYPSKETGYYTREPYFAHFIRNAKKLGFEIIEYDSDLENYEREQSQAINIKRILDKDKNAKIFVYAGIDHILELNPSKKRMAEYFNEYTGINPLTLNQVRIIANIPTEFEIFPSKEFNNFKGLNTNVDYFIINNINPTIDRVFRETEFTSAMIKLDNKNLKRNENLLVLIYNENEYKVLKNNTIPISIFSKKNIEKNIKFDFPKGKYFVKVMSSTNNSVFADYLDVK